MPYRWRCCKCDNGWMTIQAEQNICTWSECRHVKCNGCDQKNMAAPLGSGGGDIIIGGGRQGGGRGGIGRGGCCGHFISHSHSHVEIALDEEEGDSRISECSTALVHSSLLALHQPIDGAGLVQVEEVGMEGEEQFSHDLGRDYSSENEDGDEDEEDGLVVPRPFRPGKMPAPC